MTQKPEIPCAEGCDLRVMSQKLLFYKDVNEPRADLMRDVILRYLPDILGLQEVNPAGYGSLIPSLADIYDAAGDKIGDFRTYTPVLYLRDKYACVSSGASLLALRATDTKSLSWAVLESRETKRRVGIVNIHGAIILPQHKIDGTNAELGEIWRVDNSREILACVERIGKDYGCAVVCTGDFNAKETAHSYALLTEKLADARYTAEISADMNTGTFHAVGAMPAGKTTDAIDHVLITPESVISLVHRIDREEKTLSATDHCPVIADLRFR